MDASRKLQQMVMSASSLDSYLVKIKEWRNAGASEDQRRGLDATLRSFIDLPAAQSLLSSVKGAEGQASVQRLSETLLTGDDSVFLALQGATSTLKAELFEASDPAVKEALGATFLTFVGHADWKEVAPLGEVLQEQFKQGWIPHSLYGSIFPAWLDKALLTQLATLYGALSSYDAAQKAGSEDASALFTDLTLRYLLLKDPEVPFVAVSEAAAAVRARATRLWPNVTAEVRNQELERSYSSIATTKGRVEALIACINDGGKDYKACRGAINVLPKEITLPEKWDKAAKKNKDVTLGALNAWQVRLEQQLNGLFALMNDLKSADTLERRKAAVAVHNAEMAAPVPERRPDPSVWVQREGQDCIRLIEELKAGNGTAGREWDAAMLRLADNFFSLHNSPMNYYGGDGPLGLITAVEEYFLSLIGDCRDYTALQARLIHCSSQLPHIYEQTQESLPTTPADAMAALVEIAPASIRDVLQRVQVGQDLQTQIESMPEFKEQNAMGLLLGAVKREVVANRTSSYEIRLEGLKKLLRIALAPIWYMAIERKIPEVSIASVSGDAPPTPLPVDRDAKRRPNTGAPRVSLSQMLIDTKVGGASSAPPPSPPVRSAPPTQPLTRTKAPKRGGLPPPSRAPGGPKPPLGGGRQPTTSAAPTPTSTGGEAAPSSAPLPPPVLVTVVPPAGPPPLQALPPVGGGTPPPPVPPGPPPVPTVEIQSEPRASWHGWQLVAGTLLVIAVVGVVFRQSVPTLAQLQERARRLFKGA